MAVAGSCTLDSQFPGIGKRLIAGIRKRASVQGLDAVQPFYKAKILLQPAAVVSERMGCYADSPETFYIVDKILG